MKMCKKAISLAVMFAFLVSTVCIPAVFAAPIEGVVEPTGDERVVISFVDDQGTELTSFTAGQEAYMVVSLKNVSTFASFNMEVDASNMTFVGTKSDITALFAEDSAMSKFEIPTNVMKEVTSTHAQLSVSKDISKPELNGINKKAPYENFGEVRDVDLLKIEVKVNDGLADGTSVGVTPTLSEVRIGEASRSGAPVNSNIPMEGGTLTVGAAGPVVTYEYELSFAGGTSEFATDAEAEAAVIVTKKTLTDGEVTASEDVTDEATSIAAENGTVTVVIDGETLTIPYTITQAVTTYDNFNVTLTENNFRTDVTDDVILSYLTVTAEKLVDGVSEGTVTVPASGYEVKVTRDTDAMTGEVVVTFKDVYAAGGEMTANFTLYEDVEYVNYNATMDPEKFPDGVDEATILAAVKVTADKMVNDKFVATESIDNSECTISVDDTTRKITVTFPDGSGKVLSYKVGDQITLEVKANAEEVAVGETITATVYADGIDPDILVSGGKIKVTYENVAFVSADGGAGYTVLDADTSTAGEVVVDFSFSGEAGRNPGNELFKLTFDTAASTAGTVAAIEVVEAVDGTLETIEGDDFGPLNAYYGNPVEVDIVEIPTTGSVNAAFKISTLGSVSDAADKFIDGLTVTDADGAAVELDSTVSVDNNHKTINITNLRLPAGTYTITLDVAGYTKAAVEVTVAFDAENNVFTVTGGTTYENGQPLNTIYAGDNNRAENALSENIIDMDDVANVIGAYGDAVSDVYDIYTADGAGTINRYDVGTVVYNFELLKGQKVGADGLLAE